MSHKNYFKNGTLNKKIISVSVKKYFPKSDISIIPDSHFPRMSASICGKQKIFS
jgi:hypothetical protein